MALSAPGLVLGVGFGGFLDGILFHRILRWHHFVSSSGPRPDDLSGLRQNLLADGLFDLFPLTVMSIGALLLWREGRRGRRLAPGRVLAGSVLAGWGLFNLADGLVFHLLLNLHNLREGVDALPYEAGYLALALGLIAAGLLLARRPGRRAQAQARTVAPR